MVAKDDAAVAEVTSQLGGMNLSASNDFLLEGCHPRPNFGKDGKAIRVEANMFLARMAEKSSGAIYHYDLTITRVVKVQKSEIPKMLAEKIWLQACRQEEKAADKEAFNNSAFDLMKNVYTPNQFKPDASGKRNILVELPEAGREMNDRQRFKVALQQVNVVDLQCVMAFCKKDKQAMQMAPQVLTSIQALNILLRDDPSRRYKPMGARGRFFSLEDASPISGGAIVARGFFQSLRPANCGNPGVQLDCAFTALFRSGPLMNLLPELIGGGGGGGRGGRGGRGGPRGRGGPPGGGVGHMVLNELTPHQINKLNKLLYNAKFELPYKKNSPGRQFTLKKITAMPAQDIRFVVQGRDGAADRTVTIVQYFKEQYNINISKPRMPCVQYGKNFMVPIELVHLKDFNAVPFSQLSSDQAADMIRVAAQRPTDRSAAIKKWRQTLAYTSPKIRAWGLEVNKNMHVIDARVLQPPPVTYRNGKQLRPAFGGWNLRGVSFARPGAPLKSWAVVTFDDRFPAPEVQKFLVTLINYLKQYGINVANPRPHIIEMNKFRIRDGLMTACQKAFMDTKTDPQLVVCIMGGRDTALYQEIKNTAAMKLKAFVPTQCLQSSKLRSDRGLDQYCGNVAMKIQCKLGGVTHEVPMPQFSKSANATTMMIGADVTHPPPAGRGGLIQPSIAVSVGGIDPDNVKFSVGIRLQEGRTEIIKDLEKMVVEHLQKFKATSNHNPASIVFFRDGVSEGQYMQVTRHEVQAVRNAAKAHGGPNYNPKITFVICAKRHNMRFFGTQQADMDRTNNLNPGTVVDNGVTHPYAFDFYLQAHAGLQGTARPTHYVVLVDDNGFDADKMQNFVNRLCYTYARATRAVSLVPVAYYADVIANQCRFMAYVDDDATETGTTTSSGNRNVTRAYNAKLISDRLKVSIAKDVAWYM